MVYYLVFYLLRAQKGIKISKSRLYIKKVIYISNLRGNDEYNRYYFIFYISFFLILCYPLRYFTIFLWEKNP